MFFDCPLKVHPLEEGEEREREERGREEERGRGREERGGERERKEERGSYGSLKSVQALILVYHGFTDCTWLGFFPSATLASIVERSNSDLRPSELWNDFLQRGTDNIAWNGNGLRGGMKYGNGAQKWHEVWGEIEVA